jgi:formyl-CoA transferase
MLEQHRLEDGTPIKLPGIVPKLGDDAGQTRWLGPKLGAHTEEVLSGVGYSRQDIDTLRGQGII